MSMAGGRRSDGPTPVAASPLPLKGAEARGSKPTCVGLDVPRKGRVSRPCGLQGTPVAWQSQIHGVRWDRCALLAYRVIWAAPLTVALTSPLPASVGSDSSAAIDIVLARAIATMGTGPASLVDTLTSRTV